MQGADLTITQDGQEPVLRIRITGDVTNLDRLKSRLTDSDRKSMATVAAILNRLADVHQHCDEGPYPRRGASK